MKKLSKLLLALSFVLSITTSAFAVTVVSWGGAYTESQKLGDNFCCCFESRCCNAVYNFNISNSSTAD